MERIGDVVSRHGHRSLGWKRLPGFKLCGGCAGATMKSACVFAMMLLLVAPCVWGAGASSKYSILHDTLDGGGRRLQSSRYTIDTSLQWVGGISQTPEFRTAVRLGYTGQLSEDDAKTPNASPSISSLANQTVPENSSAVQIEFVVGDVETPAENLIVSGESSNTALVPNSSLVFGGSAANRTLQLTPVANRWGTTSITITVLDADGIHTSRSFELTVEAVNDAPVANEQNIVTDQNVPVAMTLSGSDIEGSPLSFRILDQPARGSLSGTLPNITYTPDAGQTGTDSFTFVVNDGTADSAPATITILINAVSALLSIDPIAAQSMNEDTVRQLVFTIVADATLTESLDLAATSSNPALVPVSGLVIEGTGLDRTLRISSAANQSGETIVTLTVSDALGNAASRSFLLTVVPVNDPPSAFTQNVTTAEDKSVAIRLEGSDIENDALSFVLVSSPQLGTLSGTPPNLVFTPSLDANGADSFTFKVNDGQFDSPLATVQLTITAENDAPIATAQSVVTDEDVPKSITLSGSDVENSSLTYTLVSQPSKGTLTGTPPTLTYTPHANVSGTDSFSFRVNDGQLDSAPAAVQITINAINDPPVANPQSVATVEDTAKSIALTGSDIENSPLAFVIVSSPTQGELSGTAPNLIYTPKLNASGTDSFTFKVNDGTADSAVVAISIAIDAVNDSPVITAIAEQSSPEDTLQLVQFTVEDVETEAASLIVSGESSNQELVPNANLVFGESGSERSLAITPATDRFGTTTITITVIDGGGASAQHNLVLTVTPVNDPPVAAPITVTTDENLSVEILLTGSDAENDSLQFTIVAQPEMGVLSGTPPVLTYTPNAGTSGLDSFTFKANDGTADSSAAMVEIVINAVNEALTISSIASQATAEETPITVGFAIGPETDDSLSLTGTSSNPTLVPEANIEFGGAGSNRTVTVRPALNESGIATITVRASQKGVEVSRSFVLTVTAVNDPPVASASEPVTLEDHPVSVTLTGSDAENGSLAFQVLSQPENGALSGTAPNLIYTPAANFFGTDTFRFKVNDGVLDSSEATVTIRVEAVNDVPSIDPIANLSLQEDAGEQTMMLTGISPGHSELAAQTLSFTVSSSDPSLTGTPFMNHTPGATTAALQFYPSTNAFGIATITVVVRDDGGTANGGVDTVTRQFTVTISAANDPPTISTIPDTATVQGATPTLAFVIDDVDSQELRLTATSSDPVLIPAANVLLEGTGKDRTVRITSAPGRTGTATITVTVADDANAQASAPFMVTVSSPTPKIDPVVSWSQPAPITYGVPLGSAHLNPTSTVAGRFEFAPSLGAVLAAGEHLLTATFLPEDDVTHNSASASVTLVVEKAALTIQADDKVKREGAPLPELTATFFGLVNEETASSLNLEIQLTTTATATSSNGSYPIVVTGGSLANYTVTYVNGTLITTSKLIPSLTWDPPSAITYGTPLGSDQLRAQADVRGTFTYDPVAGAVVSAGANQLLSVRFTPEDSLNFETISMSVFVNVARAPLTIRADDQAKLYGAPLPQLTATYTGFVNGETAGDLDAPPVFTTEATSASSVGQYPIVAGGAVDANYTISFVHGQLTISPAPLTVRADDKAMVYGAELPSLTATVVGLLNGDHLQDLDAPPVLTSAVTSTSAAGTYPIEVQGGRSENYAITHVNGTFTVSPRTLTVTPNDASRQFGEPNPPLSGRIRGLRNADPITATYSTPASAESPLGTYPIIAALSDPQGKLGNYTVVLNEGTLTVQLETSFAGVAHDGYVANALVFFDANKDGVRNSNEPFTQTDSAGAFQLPVLVETFDQNASGALEPSEGSIVLSGGIDITTGIPLQNILTAPPGATVISPITTLLTAAIEANPTLTVEQSKARLNESLGIPASVEVTTYDPIAAATANDSRAAGVITAGAKIQDTLVQISSVLAGGNTSAKPAAGRAVAAALAQSIESGGSINLDAAATVQSVIERSAERLGKAVGADVATAAATLISGANQVKSQVAAAASSPVEAAIEISRTQVAGHSVVASALEQVATGLMTVSQALTQASQEMVTQAVQAAPVGDLVGDDERPGTFEFSAEQYATSAGGTRAEVTVHRSNGNVGAVPLQLVFSLPSATVPLATHELLVEDRILVKTIDLLPTILGNSELNGREQLKLELAWGAQPTADARLGTRRSAVLTIRIPPRISRQPVSQLSPAGRPITFSVAASGTPAPSYQWRKNGAALPGQTGATLVLSSLTTADEGNYDVLVSNLAGTVSSTPASLLIALPPEIRRSPASQSLAAGGVIRLEVTAAGTAPFIYAWEKDGRTIPGAVHPFLNLLDVRESDSGEYRVRVSNPGGAVVSGAAFVSVYRAPVFEVQPRDQEVLIGSPVRFTSRVAGTGPLSFQWHKDNRVISGATSAELELPQSRLADSGFYWVEVTSPFAKVKSSAVRLTVASPPVIRTHPIGRTISTGQDIRLTVDAVGTEPLGYQWFKDGVPLAGRTEPFLAIASAGIAQDGVYNVRVNNAIGTATSATARVRVVAIAAPVISVQPQSQTVSSGSRVEFVVEAAGDPPLSYQWFKGSQAIAGAAANRFEIAAAQSQDAGEYTVVVSNPAGGVFSAVALLVVQRPSVPDGDLNGDGRAEIVFQDGGGFIGVWVLRGTEMTSAHFTEPATVGDPNWRLVGTGDANGDGQEDLFFQHTDGTLAVWWMKGFVMQQPVLLEPQHPGDRNWRVIGTGDLNQDGRPDLVFQHADATLAVWLMDGAVLREAVLLNPPRPAEPRWTAVAVADFDSDGTDDLLLQHGQGTLAVWFMKGTQIDRGLLLEPSDPGSQFWRVAAASDWDQDGHADILFQNWADGTLAIWFMNGAKLLDARLLNPVSAGGTWRPAAPR